LAQEPIPIEGGEKGLPHYLFNKELIGKEFKNFTERKIWVDSEKRHYCFLAKLKGVSQKATARLKS